MNEGDDLFDDEDDEALLEAAASYQDDLSRLEKLPPLLRSSLLPFQREGVLFGLKKEGRVLLADEMGLGKTIQAIAIASQYSSEWPMLVVVPSSMKYVWLDELQRWLPHITPDSIHLVRCSEDVPNLARCKISIVSYGLFQQKRFFSLLENLNITFNVIICDESHYLKNWKSCRTKHLVKLLHLARRRILLTGTPALARPEELYTQIKSVTPKMFGSYTQYCERYCQGHYNYRLRRFDVSGASNLGELHNLLTEHVMIRRLKANVLKQLPAKQRQKISFDLPASSMKQIEAVKLKLEALQGSEGNQFHLNKCIMELYKLTGLAKIPASVEYIREMLKQGNKFLVFAHHLAMLDAIEKELISARTDYIRIDGSVSAVQRQEFVKRYQSTETCLVALLGIQAAGVGLTLTSASRVVFCELHWSPGILHQAEDRVHRISQKNAVNVYYLIGLGTMDEMLWKKLNRKVDVVGKTLEGRGGDMNTNETENDDLKSVLASCTAAPAGTGKRGREPASKTEKPAISFTPGQTKLTAFLNLSVDEDFVDPRMSGVRGASSSRVRGASSSRALDHSKPSSSTSARVDDILEKAQDRRDKLRVTLFERKVKKRRSEEREKKTSSYFPSTQPVVVLDLSDDDAPESKRVCTSPRETTTSPGVTGRNTRRRGKQPKAKVSVDMKQPKAKVSVDLTRDERTIIDIDGSDAADKPSHPKNHPMTVADTDAPSAVPDEQDDRANTSLNSNDSDLPEISFLEEINPSAVIVEDTTAIVIEETTDTPDVIVEETSCTPAVILEDSSPKKPPLSPATAPTLKTSESGQISTNTVATSPVKPTPVISAPSTSQSSEFEGTMAPNSLTTEEDSDSDVDLFTDLSRHTIQFSVSAHTERVYFYDYAGRYLEDNCLLQDITDGSPLPDLLAGSARHLEAAQHFAKHWDSISKATKTKLYSRVITDLEEELKKLYDSRVVSTTRHTRGPAPGNLPDTVTLVRNINVGKKKVEVEQSFTPAGDPLCTSCSKVIIKMRNSNSEGNPKLDPATNSNSEGNPKLDPATNCKLTKLPFQGRFCSLECSKSYGIKANSHFVRNILFGLELGVCQICGLDTSQLIRQLRLGEWEERAKLLNSTILRSLTERQKKNIVEKPTEGLLWQADHIIPVAEGGGECDIENYRTLCTVCHKVETKKLMARLAAQKSTASNKKMGIKDIRKFLG